MLPDRCGIADIDLVVSDPLPPDRSLERRKTPSKLLVDGVVVQDDHAFGAQSSDDQQRDAETRGFHIQLHRLLPRQRSSCGLVDLRDRQRSHRPAIRVRCRVAGTKPVSWTARD